MSSSERQYAPTDRRLDELRRAGIAPWSRDVLTFGVLAGAGAAFAMLGQSWLAGFMRATASAFSGANDAGFGPMLALGGAACGIIVSAIGFGALFAGLIQTRFLFAYPKGWGAGVASVPAEGTLPSRLGAAVFGMLKSTLTIGVAYVLARQIASRGWELIVTRPTGIVVGRFFATAVREVYLGLCVVAAVVAVVSAITTHIWFRREQRMTREEVESEMRESDVNPDVRRAMRERG